MEIAQAINSTGSIDANWVLVGITTVAGFLVWNQLKEIKDTLRDLRNLVQLHDKEIAILKEKQRDE